MDVEYESVLLVKNEVFVYQIPPRTSNRNYRAADWKLEEPQWTGRMRLTSKGDKLSLKLEDRDSCMLFAQCPVDQYPGASIEPVSDSSRYFVIRIVSDKGDKAFIGIGFADRGDSFDLNVSLQDYFKKLKNPDMSSGVEGAGESSAPKLDLSFKAGETIKINIGNKGESSRPRRPQGSSGGGAIGLLPPPPGPSSRNRAAPVPNSQPTIANATNSTPAASKDEWSDFLSQPSNPVARSNNEDSLLQF